MILNFNNGDFIMVVENGKQKEFDLYVSGNYRATFFNLGVALFNLSTEAQKK